MNYNDFLKKSAEKTGTISCTGFDPVMERIPLKGEPEEVLFRYAREMIEGFEAEDCMPAAFKPNMPYYEQYGLAGLRALKKTVKLYRQSGVPFILDSKRGDIGRSSTAYANALFDYWQADAVTVAPYMGHDSVQPFFREGKGVYVLCRTSNPGAGDFQDDVYMKVARKVMEWGCGAVVGATYPEELGKIAGVMQGPLLIPGVGAQGGSINQVMEQLSKHDYDVRLARINSSSGIYYAYEKEETDDYVGAAVKALKKLNSELKTHLND